MKQFYFVVFLMTSLALSVSATTSEVLHEGFESGALPAGWSQEYVSRPITVGVDTAAYSWKVETSDSLRFPFGAMAGSSRAYARNATTDELRFKTRLITPVLNLTQGLFQPQLVFSHAEPAKAGSSDTLRVYYRTSASDIWHPYQTAVYARNAAWKTEIIGVIAPSSTYQFAFEITENMGYGVVLDEVIVRSTPTCMNVTNLKATNVHAYDAFLSWSEEGSFNEFEVMLTSAPVTDFSTIDPTIIVRDIKNIYNTETTITGLSPETTYYAYVRSDCAENQSGYTDWVGTQFTTLVVINLPYSQNFNNPTVFEGNVYFGTPYGWTIGTSMDIPIPFVYKGGTAAERAPFSIDSTAYLSFNGALSATSSAIEVGEYAYAVTPEIIDPSIQGTEISFWATAYDKVTVGKSSYAASVLVGVMEDPADFTTFKVLDTITISSSYLFRRYTLSLKDYTGTCKFIALASRFNQRNAIYIDNFSLSKPTAFVPTEVKVSNTLSTGFTVSAVTHGADSWNVKVSTAYSRNGQVNPSTIICSQNAITTSSYALSSAALSGQIVYVYTQSVKGGVTSDWSFPITVRVPSQMTVPYTNACEVSGGQIALKNLNQEVRTASTLAGASSVYFPVTSISADVKSYPALASTKPNYQGAHIQLEGIDSWFVLPEVNAINTLKLVFRYATSAGKAGALEIGIMSDPYDLATFEHIAYFAADETATTSDDAILYNRCLVSFDAYAGQGRYIAFRSLDANVPTVGSVNLIDQIVVEELGDCREASNVEATVKANDAEITWNGGGMDGWIVGLSTMRSMLNAQYDTVYTPTIAFDNLQSEKTYYYTIQTICNGQLMDLDDVSYSFTTPRGLPFTEKFNTAAIPNGWKQYKGTASSVFNGGALTPVTSSTYDVMTWSVSASSTYRFSPQAGNVAYIQMGETYYSYPDPTRTWLVSPTLQLAKDIDALELKFDMGIHGYGNNQADASDKFMVIVSTDAGNTWLRQDATVWSNDGQGDYVLNDLNWEASQAISIDFTPYVGKKIQIAFYAESTSDDFENYISIDNIELKVADPACGGLSNLRGTALGSTAAQLRWTLAGVDPYPALVQIAKNAQFTSILHTDTVRGTSITYNDLESSTTYYARARQLCPELPDWVTCEFHTACDSKTPQEFGVETFDNAGVMNCWTVGFTYNNGSTNLPQRQVVEKFGPVLEMTKTATDSTASDGAYAITPEFNIPDSMNHYQVVFRAGSNSSVKTNVHRVVVGVVTDPADPGNTFERIATVNLAAATDSLDMKTYVVSFENYTGDLDENYGRYVMFLSEAGSDSTNFVYIDNVSLEVAQGCHQVLNLEADSATAQGARLTWTGNGSQYEIILTASYVNPDTVTTSALIHEVVSGSPYYVSGLDATTTYYVYIRSICAPGDSSRWSSATRFMTTYGLPFYESFYQNFFTNSDWTRKAGLFVGDSVSLTASSTKWSAYDMSTIQTVKGMAGYAIRGNIYSTSMGKDWFLTPEIDLGNAGDAELQLSFDVAITPYGTGGGASESSDKRLGVGVSTDGGKTFYKKDMTFWDCDGRGQYDFRSLGNQAQRFTIDLTDYAGQKVVIGFYGESTGSSTDLYYYFDSVSIIKQEAICLGARKLKFQLTDDLTAKASWERKGTPEEMILMLAYDADFKTIVRCDTTSDTSFVYTNLEYNHSYYLMTVQPGCTTIKTASLVTKRCMPFVENFIATTMPVDWNLFKGNAANVMAGTDTLKYAPTSTAWKISTSSNGLPANHLVGELINLSSQNESWIVTPQIKLLAVEADEHIGLQFDLALTTHNKATAPTSAANEEFRVLVSTDDGATWLESNSWLYANKAGAYKQLSAIPNTGERQLIYLDAFAAQTIRLAFYKASTVSSPDNDIHVGNIAVAAIGEPCAEPDSLRLNQVSFTSADISWNGLSNKTTLIEYSTLADFSSALTDTLVGGLTYHLSDLAMATTYYVRVMQVCGPKSQSGYSNTITFRTSLGLPYYQPFASGRDDWQCYKGVVGETPSLTLVSSTSLGWKNNTTATILGGNHLTCAHQRTGTDYWIISPMIDLTPDTNVAVIAMQFDMAMTASSSNPDAPDASKTDFNVQQFNVMISLDNGITWLKENTWIWSQGDTAQFRYSEIPAGAGKTYQMDITRFGGKQIRVALVALGSATGSQALNVNDFRIEALQSNCFGVSNAIATAVDTAATIVLTPADNAKKWQVAYGIKNTPIEDMRMVVSDSTLVTLSGIALSSTYEMYARSICGEGDTSSWAGPFTFVSPQGVPYIEPFRNSLSNWSRYMGDPTDIYADQPLVSTTAGWATSTYAQILGEEHIYCAKTTSAYYWLVSPTINLMPNTGDKGLYLSFDIALTSSASYASSPLSTNGHSFRVVVSEDDGATWRETNEFLWAADSVGDYTYAEIPAGKGRDYHLDITRFAGKTIRVALVMGAASTGSSCINVNDLSIEEFAVPCFGVASITAEYEKGIATCTIIPSDSAKTWQYVCVNSGQSPDQGTPVNVTTTKFMVNNLPMSSTLDFYARSLCGTTDTSAWAGPATIKTPKGVRYAEPMNWTSMDPEWSLYSYSATSGTFSPATTGWSVRTDGQGFSANHVYTNTYGTFQRMLASPVLDLATVSSKHIQLSFDMALTKYSSSSTSTPVTSVNGQSFKIMASIDKGNSWEDVALWGDGEGEFDYSMIPLTGQNYQVDMTNYAGEEVMIGFFAISTVSGADNNLHIKNVVVDTLSTGATCASITRATLLDSTYTTATLVLRGPGITDALSIEYVCIPRGSLFRESLKQITDTNIVYIKGLQSSTAYELYARTQCPDSTYTEWRGPFTFHTVECSTVTGISQAILTLNDAQITLSADNVTDAVGYQLYLTEQGGVLDESAAIMSKTNVFVFSYPFRASQWYDVYARKICQEGDTSAWCEPIAIHAPYGVRYEESMEWDAFSEEWQRYTGSLTSLETTTSGWTVTSATNTYGFEGKHVKVNTWAEKEYLMASPRIDLSNVDPTSGLVLSFDAAFTHYNQAAAPSSYANRDFYVLVSTDGRWSTSQGWHWSETAGDYLYSSIAPDGTSFDLDLSTYVGQSVQIGFYVTSTTGTEDCDMHIRNIVIDTLGAVSSTCAGVDSVEVSNITLNSAKVNFVFKNAESTKRVYYELALDKSFTLVVQADTVINSMVFGLNALSPSTNYYLRIRQMCSANDESSWSRAVSFSTLKGVRYQEDFEESNFSSEWKSVRSIPISEVYAGRQNPLTGETVSSYSGSWNVASAAKGMTSKHIRVNCYGTSCASWAISPSIDLTPNKGQALLFAFDVSAAKFSGNNPAASAPDDQFTVVVSTDNGVTWTKANSYVWSDSAAIRTEGTFASLPYNPVRKVLNFSQYAGKRIRIAFYAESTISNGDNYLMVDSLDLNATQMFAYTDTLCEGSEYESHGFKLTTADLTPGLHEYTRISATMDSVVTLSILVKANAQTHFSDEICEGDTYTEHGYNLHVTASGTYRRVLTAANGCDSIVYLDLTVLPVQRTKVNLYACRGTSYTLLGKTYYTNAVVRDTLSSMVTGCDSIVTYYLFFSSQSEYKEHIRIALCEGDTVWVDDTHFVTQPGFYTFPMQSSYHCDSTVYVHALAINAQGMAYDTIMVNELPYLYNGIQRIKAGAESGDYTLSVVTSCGDIKTLQVTVLEGTGLIDIYADPSTGATKVIYQDHLYIIMDDKWYDPTGQRVF